MLSSDLHQLAEKAEQTISSTSSIQELDAQRVALLGKNGEITKQLQRIKDIPPEERRDFGAAVNVVKDRIAMSIDQRMTELQEQALIQKLASERCDMTMPPREEAIKEGTVHPISQATEAITTIFTAMGFAVETGPNIEDDFRNFTALNIPESHPARDSHDTFYMTAEAAGATPNLLRTHTSTVQIRKMQEGKPPFKFIAPGRVYRCDSDLTHTPMFHQVEGLYIDKNVTMAQLKGTIIEFCRLFFEVEDLPIRFRSSFFPFVTHGAEVDIGCKRNKDAIEIGAGDDWLEILGCGMVHPHVLEQCGVDPHEYQGFAFGMGIERLAMLKYGIPDLRTFFEGDVRWLQHYGFKAWDAPSVAGGLSQ